MEPMGYVAAGALIVSTVLGGLAYADESSSERHALPSTPCSAETRKQAKSDLERKLLALKCQIQSAAER